MELCISLYFISVVFHYVTDNVIYFKMLAYMAKKGYRYKSNTNFEDFRKQTLPLKQNLLGKIANSKNIDIIPILNLVVSFSLIYQYKLNKDKIISELRIKNLIVRLTDEEVKFLEQNGCSIVPVLNVYEHEAESNMSPLEKSNAKVDQLSDAIIDKIENKNLTDNDIKKTLYNDCNTMLLDEKLLNAKEKVELMHNLNEKLNSSNHHGLYIVLEYMNDTFKENYVNQYQAFYPELQLLDNSLRHLNALVVDARKNTNNPHYINISYFPYIKEQMADIMMAVYNNDIRDYESAKNIILFEIYDWYPELREISYDDNKMNAIINQIIDVLGPIYICKSEDKGNSKILKKNRLKT